LYKTVQIRLYHRRYRNNKSNDKIVPADEDDISKQKRRSAGVVQLFECNDPIIGHHPSYPLPHNFDN
jgi:hypothetical protein